MRVKDYGWQSLASATGVLAYVAGVVWFGFNLGRTLEGQQNFSYLQPMFALLLFVVSAAITGLLVLGRPIHLYLSSHHREAFILLFATLGWLVAYLLVLLVALLLL